MCPSCDGNAGFPRPVQSQIHLRSSTVQVSHVSCRQLNAVMSTRNTKRCFAGVTMAAPSQPAAAVESGGISTLPVSREGGEAAHLMRVTVPEMAEWHTRKLLQRVLVGLL